MTIKHIEVMENFINGMDENSPDGSSMHIRERWGKIRLGSSLGCVAIKLRKRNRTKAKYLVNADNMSNSGWGGGRAHYNNDFQMFLNRRSIQYVSIPFSALLNVVKDSELEEIGIIDNQNDDWEKELDSKGNPTGNMTHVLGGVLFNVGQKYYVCGIDQGFKTRGLGYFLCQIPGSAKTLEKAYELLKPKGIEGSENSRAYNRSVPNVIRDYWRQGEFFFTPVSNEFLEERIAQGGLKKAKTLYSPWINRGVHHKGIGTPEYDKEQIADWKSHIQSIGFEPKVVETDEGYELYARSITQLAKDDKIFKQMDLAKIWASQGDSGNPHMARDVIWFNGKEVYARGTIRHPEHHTIKLGDQWHRVYINRALVSFSAIGDVD